MQIESSGGVAVLPMRAGKANAIGSAFLERLSAQLDAVEASGAAALVLTGEGRAFSAGLDLPEISALDRGALERFIRRFSAAGDYRIGLNEVAIGLGLPAVVLETLRCQVSPGSLGPVALEGRLLSPEEAQTFGLVEAVLPPAVLLEQARGRAAELAALP